MSVKLTRRIVFTPSLKSHPCHSGKAFGETIASLSVYEEEVKNGSNSVIFLLCPLMKLMGNIA